MRSWVGAVLDGLRVTDKIPEIGDRVFIDRQLLIEAGVEPFERVHVANCRSGARWESYVVPAGPQEFTLGGACGLLGEIGDRCTVQVFRGSEAMVIAPVLTLDVDNLIADRDWLDGAT